MAAAAPNEFADWLNPIVVKELRQGLRTRVFVGSFLLLQIAMVFLALFGVSAAAGGTSTEGYSAGYWILVGIPLLLIMPGSGLGAVASERKANTLELVFLSRLTARRILMGKWVALLLQSVLLVCAAIPYGVLRYFLGGVNVTEELEMLGALLFFSAVFSGIAVGISPLPLAVTRTLFVLAVIFAMQGVPTYLMLRAFGGMGGSVFWMLRGPSGGSTLVVCLLSLAFAGAVLYLFWEYGAGLIAPPVENHSTPLRLLALGTLVAGAVVGGVAPKYRIAAFVPAMILGTIICLGLVSERLRLIPSLYRPFVRRGGWGRAAGFLLYPGWPAGVLFTVFFFGLFAALGVRLLPPPGHGLSGAPLREFLLATTTGLGVLLLPVALIRCFYPRVPRPFLAFFLIQVASVSLFVLTAVAKAFSSAIDPSQLFRVLPLYAFLSWGASVPALEKYGAAACVTALTLLLLLWRMREPWREIRACERQAAS